MQETIANDGSFYFTCSGLTFSGLHACHATGGESGETLPRPEGCDEHQASHIAAALGVKTSQLYGLLKRHPNLSSMPARHLISRMQRLAQTLNVPMQQVN